MGSFSYFKKNTHIKIILAFIIFSGILFSIYRTTTSENLIYNPQNTSVSLDIQYSIDGLSWFYYNPLTGSPYIEKNDVVWVRLNIPYTQIENATLFLTTHNLLFDVFFDYGPPFSIYATDSLNAKPMGLINSFIEIPPSHTSDTIIIKTFNTSDPTRYLHLQASYGMLYDLIRYLFTDGVFDSVVSSVFLSIGFILMITFYKKANSEKINLYLGAFLTLYGIYILIAINPLTRSMLQNLIFWQTLSIFIIYIMFIFIMLVLSTVFPLSPKFFRLMINIILLFIIVEIINPPMVHHRPLSYILLICISLLSLYRSAVNIKNIGVKASANKIIERPYHFFVLFLFVLIWFMYYNGFGILNTTGIDYSYLYILFYILMFISIAMGLFLHSLKSFDKNVAHSTFVTLQKKLFITNILKIQSDLQKIDDFKESSDYLIDNYIHTVYVDQDAIRSNYSSNYLKHNPYETSKEKILNNISAFIAIDKSSSDSLDTQYALKIISASGIYKDFAGKLYSEVFTEEDTEIIRKCSYLNNPDFVFKDDISLILESPTKTTTTLKAIVYFYGTENFTKTQKSSFKTLLSVYSSILKNLILIDTLKNSEVDTFFNLSALSEARSKETSSHIKRVSEYSKLLGLSIGLPNKDLELLYLASIMHDIGKLSTPDAILNKPGKLTYEEFEIMKNHALEGHNMLNYLADKSELMNIAANIAHFHHEKYDGTGYYGLVGESISIYARIVALADVFDALASDRVYKKAWPLEKILKLIQDERGKHFDPVLVDKFFENLDGFLAIKNKFLD
jgi:response regulator RpfG family c-di-GMP phosphodiesterase